MAGCGAGRSAASPTKSSTARRLRCSSFGELRRQHLSVKVAVVNGHAAEVIIDEAARRGADLIVMATHGYSGLRRWAMGSVADKVLHATRTPLVLVRARASGQATIAE